jgi:hypothetical protein
LVSCNSIDGVGDICLKLVELLQLGKLEQGSVSPASKVNSRNARWFNQKPSKDKDASALDIDGDDALHIQRDSLIQMNLKRADKTTAIEYYQVLAFFSKHYNKWFIAPKQRYVWNNATKKANMRVLVRMMQQIGTHYQEVDLRLGGGREPKEVFCVIRMSDVLTVGNELEETIY